MSTAATESRSFLDTVWARLIAAIVAVAGIALFVNAWVAGGPDGALAGNPAYQECMAERLAAIENLRQEANLSISAVELHQARAEAFCRQQAGL